MAARKTRMPMQDEVKILELPTELKSSLITEMRKLISVPPREKDFDDFKQVAKVEPPEKDYTGPYAELIELVKERFMMGYGETWHRFTFEYGRRCAGTMINPTCR